MTNAIEILQKGLRKRGYAGLVDPDIRCAGCSANELMKHCRFLNEGCKPAYRLPCSCGNVFYSTDKDAKKCDTCKQDSNFDIT